MRPDSFLLRIIFPFAPGSRQLERRVCHAMRASVATCDCVERDFNTAVLDPFQALLFLQLHNLVELRRADNFAEAPGPLPDAPKLETKVVAPRWKAGYQASLSCSHEDGASGFSCGGIEQCARGVVRSPVINAHPRSATAEPTTDFRSGAEPKVRKARGSDNWNQWLDWRWCRRSCKEQQQTR